MSRDNRYVMTLRRVALPFLRLRRGLASSARSKEDKLPFEKPVSLMEKRSQSQYAAALKETPDAVAKRIEL